MGNHHSLFKRTSKKNKNQGSSVDLSDARSHTSGSSCDSLSSNYFLKNNEEEFDRLQRTHFFTKHFFDGKNFSVPCTEILESGCRVLDIGCGSGVWVLDCATEFQKSTFIGVDIQPIFPQTIKPCNAMFIQANVLDRLPFETNAFEIVHLSNMGTAFTEQEWKQTVIPEVIRITKPGGWIEIQEFTFKTIDNGPVMTKAFNLARTYMRELGINVDFVEQMKDWLINSMETLTDVQELIVSRPMGCGEKLGPVYVDVATAAMKFLSPQYCRIMGIKEDEYNNFLDRFREEFNVYRQVLTYHRIFARKLINE